MGTFFSIILEGDRNFYGPKIKICKINYCENKVKLNKITLKIVLIKSMKSFNLSMSFLFPLKFNPFHATDLL